MTTQHGLDPITAIVLGVLQGLTEYLPVSSSGHLVIAQNLFGLQEPELLFDVTLHLGSLAVVVWYYRRDIARVLTDTQAAISGIADGGSWTETVSAHNDFRLALMVIIGTVPAGIIGVGFKKQFEALFGSPGAVGLMLMATGAILFLTRYSAQKGNGTDCLTWQTALAIGTAQALAITPGISRSGATIAVALLLGMERETAARFSFFLFIPAVTGAIILQNDAGAGSADALALALGFVASMVVGYFALCLLVSFVKRGRLPWFSWYCVTVGALAVVFMR